jgi:hypothetical protein
MLTKMPNNISHGGRDSIEPLMTRVFRLKRTFALQKLREISPIGDWRPTVSPVGSATAVKRFFSFFYFFNLFNVYCTGDGSSLPVKSIFSISTID